MTNNRANVVFLCPHGAGKSVLAATYFRAAAARLGLEATVDTAGTEPDAEVMGNVTAALRAQGFLVDWTPQLATAAALATADVIVSIGCDRALIPTSRDVIEWDVPLISVDLPGAMAAIHERAEALAAALRD